MFHSITGSLRKRSFAYAFTPYRRDRSPFYTNNTPNFASRLFGYKRGTVGNPPGTISIFNEQTVLPDLDLIQLQRTIQDIRQIIGYTTYDVTLVLTDDAQMKQLNQESRGVDAPTDILSFPFQDVIIEPGLLDEPDFDFPDYYNLGDMFIDIPYVIRRCQQDKDDNANEPNEDEDERGVSAAMANIYDPEIRFHMLLIHGMLHLVGYDHIEDDDYELMVTKEEEILKQLHLNRMKTSVDL